MDTSNHIPGIYNYCDRWCERCSFTARCRLYAMELESGIDPPAQDMRNAAFWDGLKQSLVHAVELLRNLAEEQGIDLEAAMVEAAQAEQERTPPGEKYQRLSEQADEYHDKANDWFESAGPLFESKGKDLVSHARMALPDRDPRAEADALNEAVEVIRWYAPQIVAKLGRAAESHADAVAEDEPDEFAESDADGSAKVALIAMDRSLAAWTRLYDALPDAQDALLDLLVALGRLRQAAEALFPNARSFVRPGFDESGEAN